MTAAHNRIDMINAKFGLVTVLSFSHTKNKVPYYLGRCDCGTERVFRGPYLRYRPLPSCGCKADRWANRPRKNLSRLPDGEAATRQHFRSYKFNAKSRNYEFSVTLDEFRDLIMSPCYICGIPASSNIKTYNRGGRVADSVRVNGVDRLDNTAGYLVNNLRACCGTCNVAKNDLTLTEFKLWFDRCMSRRHSWPD